MVHWFFWKPLKYLTTREIIGTKFGCTIQPIRDRLVNILPGVVVSRFPWMPQLLIFLEWIISVSNPKGEFWLGRVIRSWSSGGTWGEMKGIEFIKQRNMVSYQANALYCFFKDPEGKSWDTNTSQHYSSHKTIFLRNGHPIKIEDKIKWILPDFSRKEVILTFPIHT